MKHFQSKFKKVQKESRQQQQQQQQDKLEKEAQIKMFVCLFCFALFVCLF
jgi:membrane protein insertase Oxa1/YidC/SpoIIIJ